MRRSSTYEQRYSPRSESPTVVVDVFRGEVLGQLDEHGEVVPLDEPAADDPSSWPESWWHPVGELR